MFILGTRIYSFSILYSGILTVSVVLVDLSSFHRRFASKCASCIGGDDDVVQKYSYFSSIDIGFTGFDFFDRAWVRTHVTILFSLSKYNQPKGSC